MAMRPPRLFGVLLMCAALLGLSGGSLGEPDAVGGRQSQGDPAAQRESLTVRPTEGGHHAYLVLRTLDGTALADGDLIQKLRGDRVHSRLVFHFKDGSIRDETAFVSVHGGMRLLSARLVQKGPMFQPPLDMTIDGASGLVTVRYMDQGGDQKVFTERLDLPADLANGLMLPLLENARSDVPPPSLSMVVPTPRPRLVKLVISVAGDETIATGERPTTRQATHYVVKVDMGGVTGLLAPLLGKQPADSHVWVADGEDGEDMTFVKSEGPMFFGGPSWRVELAGPTGARPQTIAN
jgi:hypothetical protein